jgi:hypothetical protein
MKKLTPKPKPACDLVQRYRPLGLKAVLAAALQIKARRRRDGVPNA